MNFHLLPSWDLSPLRDRIRALPWMWVFLLGVLSSISLILLYSAGEGNWSPWAIGQLERLLLGLVLAFTIALTPMSIFQNGAYFLYAAALLGLSLVEIMGIAGMGAQRWLKLCGLTFQPSELMKVALILALARFLSLNSVRGAQGKKNLFIALGMIGLPCLLVMKQPDLGTAVLLASSGIMVLYGAGLSWVWFLGSAVVLTVVLPLLWPLLLPYQQNRILVFLDPERDPLGAGYHILQSKIALGSGGLWGKGFMKGTQAQLAFLPEKHTDFIFTLLCEEWGWMGALGLVLIFSCLLLLGLKAAYGVRTLFGRLVALSLTGSLALYLVINMGMCMGLLPVVGVPLPFISYGGTALLTLMAAIGFLMNIDMNPKGR